MRFSNRPVWVKRLLAKLPHLLQIILSCLPPNLLSFWGSALSLMKTEIGWSGVTSTYHFVPCRSLAWRKQRLRIDHFVTRFLIDNPTEFCSGVKRHATLLPALDACLLYRGACCQGRS